MSDECHPVEPPPAAAERPRWVRAGLSRRRFVQFSAAAGAGALIANCGGSSPGTQAPATTPNLSAPVPTSAPAVQSKAASPSAAGSPGAQAPSTGQTYGKLVLNTDPYPKYSGTPVDSDQPLNIIRSEDITTDLNPASLNAYSPYTFVYDPLLWMDEFTLDPKPWLAASWEISPDGKSYTYKLRTDIKWHDGSPLTADDVAFSMVVYRDDPNSGVARFFPLMKQDPTVVDPNTVRFDLTDPSGDWILNASNQFVIQKKQFIDYWNAGKGQSGAKTLTGYPYEQQMLIGTGPWKQTKYDPGSAPPFLQYEPNPTYMNGKPHFPQMIFKEVDQKQAELTAWLNNETDLLWPLTATDIDQVKNQDGWLYSEHTIAFMCAWINFKNPKQDHPDFFNDKNVRMALSTGMDRNGYSDSVFKGFADVTKVGSVNLPWAYNTNLKNPAFDTAKAQQTLEAAGYKKGSDGMLQGKDGKPIKLVAITSTQNQYPVDRIAVSVQEDFRNLGIDMQIDTVDPSNIKNRWQKTFDWDLYFYSRILFAGFSDYTYYYSKYDVRTNPQGRNYGGWNNADADKLLDQIIREPDLKKQKDLLWQFQAITADDMPALWLGFPNDLILVKKNIQGFQANVGWQYWDSWKLWRTK